MQISSLKIDELLARADELPSLPGIVGELLNKLRDDNTPAAEIAGLVSLDQSLSARTLKLANSAYFARRTKTSTIEEAVVVLGFSAIRAIVLGATILDVFPAEDLLKGYFDPPKYWQHSIASGAGAQWFAEMIEMPKPEDAFTAGLLHGVGLLVLDQFVGDAMKAIQEMIEVDNMTLVEAEQELFGFDHAHLGARLLEGWQLPERIIGAVQYHNYVDMATDEHLTMASAVHCGQIFARMLGHGNPGEPHFPELLPEALSALSLKPEIFPAIMEPLDQAMIKAQVFLPKSLG